MPRQPGSSVVCGRLRLVSIKPDPYTQGNIYQLENVQRRAARFVLSDSDYKLSVTEMITKLSWVTHFKSDGRHTD